MIEMIEYNRPLGPAYFPKPKNNGPSDLQKAVGGWCQKCHSGGARRSVRPDFITSSIPNRKVWSDSGFPQEVDFIASSAPGRLFIT